MSTAIGVVIESWTHPAGSTVTPVTCAANDAGRVDATSIPASSRAGNTDPGGPGGCGTVSSISPSWRATDTARTRPSALNVAQWPLASLTTNRGVSSLILMCTPSAHETLTDAEHTHGSCSMRAAVAPASTSSSGGWLASPAWSITCAADSWVLPVTVTDRAPNSGV